MTEETIFEAALGKVAPAERSEYLDKACGGDAALRRRVEALLARHARIGSFLERPAVEQMAGARAADATSAETSGDAEQTTLSFLQPPTRPGSLGRLGHYEVLEVLGRGGPGIVMREVDDKLHPVVAIKGMAPPPAATLPPSQHFLRPATPPP